MMTRAQDYLYAAVMAGGSGTRFWPRSRKDRPKQILNITGDEILLKKTIELIRPIIPISRIKVVTTESQADAVKKTAPALAPGNILREPFGKNTAPAIGLSALFIERERPDAVMVILPADHYIQDEKRFHEQVMAGVRQAFEAEGIVTIGITPRGPETGYGYIETDQLVDKRGPIYTVKSFHEKPDEERAGVFIRQGNFFWNSGIFIVRASYMLGEIAEYLPHNHERLMRIKSSLGTDQESLTINEAYQNMEAISIDYGVIERSSHVFMIPGDFGWDDVGSWPCAASHWPMDNDRNAFIGEVINLDSSECIVYSPKKPVALLGVEDLVIVEEDDVLLVSKKQRAQDVKKLVDKLRSQDRDELL
jgi:mannose-1-phosphate guanylyltransferase